MRTGLNICSLLHIRSMDAIEHIVYINLDERPDRRALIEKELDIFPPKKVQRFKAIKNVQGAIGCTFSHIRVLQMAMENGWPNYLVVEDDFMWKNLETSVPILRQLLANPYDVILLGGTAIQYYKETLRLHSGQTTTAYIVSAGYYETLMANFKEGLAGLLRTGSKNLFAIDMYWKRLQPGARWFVVAPGLCTQRPDRSDIEERLVDYTRFFI
jgi:hypothetical protein